MNREMKFKFLCARCKVYIILGGINLKVLNGLNEVQNNLNNRLSKSVEDLKSFNESES